MGTEVSNMFTWAFVSSFFRKSENMASENSEKMVGKTMEEADEMIQNEEIIHDGKKWFKICLIYQQLFPGEIITEIRPMKVDEEGMLGTCDYRTDRINVETE